MKKSFLIFALFALALSKRRPMQFTAAVVGDVINLGTVADILSSNSTFIITDCSVVVHEDPKIIGESKITILDTDPNEKVFDSGVNPKMPTYLLAELGTKACNITYTLTCKDLQTFGLVEV